MPISPVRRLATLSLAIALGLPVAATAKEPSSTPIRGQRNVVARATEAPLVAPGHVDARFAAAAARVAADRRVAPRGSAGRESSATASKRDPFTEFIGNNYFDECGDGGSFDLKKFAIIDNEADDLTYLWGTCPQSPAPTDGDPSVVFFIDDTPEGRPPGGTSMALIQNATDGTWELFETFRSSNENDWEMTQSGQGTITRLGADDGGPRDVGSIAIDALEADFPLEYFVSAVTVRNDVVVDLLPEDDMPSIRFPDGCDYFELHGASIRATDASASSRGAFTASAAAAVSTGAGGIQRADGSLLAWPLDDAAVAALDALPGVEATRPVMFKAMSDPEPTQWAVNQTRLDRAWTAVPRANSRIAVLDQGVDAGRPDLNGRVGHGYNGITGELIDPGHNSALGPHGSAVSSVAAAKRDNNLEVAGVNDAATIVPVVVFDHSSCADDRAIANGLNWAVQANVDVINLSLGGPGDSTVLEEAVDNAVASGAIVIAATGNDMGFAPNRENFPAAYPGVIGIGATGPDGLASYSQHASTEFVAPGGDSSGSREADMAVLGEWDRIEFQAGTSFSAPFVSGLVSLWLASHPGATLADVRAALTAASIDIPGDGDGAGLIDAVLLLGEATPGVRAAPAEGIDNDPATSHRLAQDQPIEASLAMSALRFPQDASAPVAVLARSDTFADALSGAPLSHDGPLLFTSSAFLDDRVLSELVRATTPDATIYLLGGPNALDESIADEIREAMPQATVHRLAGTDRFKTSRAIVDETVARFGQANQILLARGYGPAADPNGTAAWADAIAGASLATARRWPLLIVPTGALTDPDVELIVRAVVPEGLVNLLGGPNALSPAVAASAARVRTTRRIAGTNRDATAAEIAGTLWGTPTTGPGTFTLLNIRSTSGWYLGLAAAGYAASIGAPALSVNTDDIPAETVPFLARCGAQQVEIWVTGAASQVSAANLADIDRRDGGAC